MAILLIAAILYVYRWNIINPNKSGSLKIGTLDRTFVYHVPSVLKNNPRLLIVYHGSTMKANLMQILTGHEFDELADAENNTIIVYPQGYKNNWNDCRKQARYPAKQLQVDDVGFTGELISFFKTKFNIDSTNVFAVGYSNGGQMVMKLAKQQSAWFKGFAVISASLPSQTNDDCFDLQKPVSLLLMNGVNDRINPYHGGVVRANGESYGPVMSSEETLQRWLAISKCDVIQPAAVSSFRDEEDKVTAIQEAYHSTETGKKIWYAKIIDGGHTIPNRNFRIPIKKLGKMNKQVDAPKMIWDFFKALE